MELMNCIRCGKLTPKKSSKQKYCIRCGNIVNKERTRERAKERAELRNK